MLRSPSREWRFLLLNLYSARRWVDGRSRGARKDADRCRSRRWVLSSEPPFSKDTRKAHGFSRLPLSLSLFLFTAASASAILIFSLSSFGIFVLGVIIFSRTHILASLALTRLLSMRGREKDSGRGEALCIGNFKSQSGNNSRMDR